MGFKPRVIARTAVLQQWEESERGWGCRPDGWTLHLSTEDHAQYVKDFYAKYNTGAAPDEYTRICGNPRLVTVSEKVYRALVKAAKEDRKGVWGKGNQRPSEERLADPGAEVL